MKKLKRTGRACLLAILMLVRTPMNPGTCFVFGPFELAENTLQLSRIQEGRRVVVESLTAVPARLLLFLASHAASYPQLSVAFKDLMTGVWGDQLITEDTVFKAIQRARVALGDLRQLLDGGVGRKYRLNAEVRRQPAKELVVESDPEDRSPNEVAFRKVIRADSAPQITVVIPTQKTSKKSQNTESTVEDAMAQSCIVAELERQGLTATLCRHKLCNQKLKKSNLFVICGPASNSVTHDVFGRVNLPFKFEKVRRGWRICQSGSSLAWGGNGNRARDFAIVASIRNPWSLAHRIWIAAGIAGLGTEGAVYLIAYQSDKLEAALKRNGMSLSDSWEAIVSVVRKATGLQLRVLDVQSAS